MTGPMEVGALPWSILFGAAECGDDQWAVVKDEDGSVESCHDTRADALKAMQALYANEPEAAVPADGEPAAALTAAAMENDAVGTGAMVALIPSEEDAARLAMEGYEAADQLHATCVYLGDAAAFDDATRKTIIAAVAQSLAARPAFTAEAFGVAAFNPAGDSPCLVLALNGNDLADVGYALYEAAAPYASPEQHEPWIPHVTLAYDSEPESLMDQSVRDRLGPVNFDRVRVVFGGEATDIPLADPQAVDEVVDEGAVIAAMTYGTPWSAVAEVEGEWSGDGRMFAPGAVTWAEPPFPLKWQIAEADEHKGSVIVGRVDSVRREGNLIIAEGIFDDAGEFGAEALRLRRADMLRQVSIKADDITDADVELVYEIPDLDGGVSLEPPMEELVEAGDDGEDFHLPGKHNQKDHGRSSGPKYDRGALPGAPKRRQSMEGTEEAEDFHLPGKHNQKDHGRSSGPKYDRGALPGGPKRRQRSSQSVRQATTFAPEIGEMVPVAPKEIYHAGRIRSLTMVAEAAFPQCILTLPEEMTVELEPTRVEVLTASGQGWTIHIPELWPESWFDEPAPEDMPEFGGLRITAAGRITGYLAPANVGHRAFRASGRFVPVMTGIDYSEFNNKAALVAARDGGVARINAGAITFDCGHPDLNAPVRALGNGAVQEQYDNSCSVFARVRVWESPRYPGAPIVAGALLHGVDANAVERAMGCHLSGDWQAGKLNAALLVPTEGYPPSVSGTVRVREGVLVASAVPIHWEPRAASPLVRLAEKVGLDPQSQFKRLTALIER